MPLLEVAEVPAGQLALLIVLVLFNSLLWVLYKANQVLGCWAALSGAFWLIRCRRRAGLCAPRARSGVRSLCVCLAERCAS